MSCQCATGIARCRDSTAEVSRGHSRVLDQPEGPNVKMPERSQRFVTCGEADDDPAMDVRGLESSGRNPRWQRLERQASPAAADHSLPKVQFLMEAVVEHKNMQAAYARVVRNRGAAGVDHMPVEAVFEYLRAHWRQIKEQLLSAATFLNPSGVWISPSRAGKRRGCWASRQCWIVLSSRLCVR